MSIKYEYPLPKIKVDINKLNIKVNLGGSSKGKFNVKNSSKGVLSGKITSDINGLEFYPNSWSENNCDIMYIFDSIDYTLNVNLKGRVIIESDGGEVVIPISIDTIARPIVVNSISINSLEDFTGLAGRDFLKAKEIFFSEDFIKICNIKDSNTIKFYDRLKLEVYKEIALDNFLIGIKQKEPAEINFSKVKLELAIKCFEYHKIKYKIPLQILGFGTIEAVIASKHKTPWLEVQTTHITNLNVYDKQIIDAFVIIDTKLINDRKVSEIIELTGDNFSNSLALSVKREATFKVEPSKQWYSMYDRGNIIFTNNTGEDLVVELITLDEWLQFKSKKYFISKFAEIPFDIRLSKGFDLLQTPLYTTTITVKTSIKGKPIKKQIEIKVADNRLEKIYD